MLNPKPTTVLELFENHPERWTQGAYARDKTGKSLSSTKAQAVCWCLVGALRYIYDYTPHITESNSYWIALNKLNKLTDDATLSFNDGHDFDQVLDVVRKAGV